MTGALSATCCTSASRSWTLRHGRTIGHDSIRGVVYRRHQARHVAVVGDSADVVWAVAEDGADWQSVAGRDQLLAALAKGYIRHDLRSADLE